ncbi:MAG: TIR domain-containing protein [Rhizobiales bacterium]|nr:TIR domain-containing protein [Hyphomicrobiales bacterium]
MVSDQLDIAYQRIEDCKSQRQDTLDLCGFTIELRLDHPIWSKIFELTWLKKLYLGVGAEARKNVLWDLGSSENEPYNELDALPALFSTALPHLKMLSLSGTSVRDLTPLQKLTNLTVLDLSFTSVCDLAPLQSLTSLTMLDLSDTSVDDLTPLAKLTKLTELDLSYKGFLNLTPLAKLTKLSVLKLRNTFVDDVTPLQNLTNLTKLDLWESPGVSDFTPLQNLTKLTNLELYGPYGLDLTPLKNLTNLIKLRLFGPYQYELDLMPLKNLTNLIRLEVLTTTRDLTPLQNLTNLIRLDVITTTRDLTPLKNLISLTDLYLRSRFELDLTPLQNLTNLTTIDLSHCKLTNFPKDLCFQPSLKNLLLYESELAGVPQDMLSLEYGENCFSRLRDYYRALETGQEHLQDVKLIIVGNGRIGKTQIVNRISDKPFVEDADSTHGIQIKRINLPGAQDQDLTRLHVWDFGGQDIYHGTHVLFMRSRAVFMVVWREGFENRAEVLHNGIRFRNYPMNYWLHFIKRLAGLANPLMIVQNACDEHDWEESEPLLLPEKAQQLLEDFQPIPKIYHYSAKTKAGQASLNEGLGIAVKHISCKGKEFIGKNWARVKDELELLLDEGKTRILSMDEFKKLCRGESEELLVVPENQIPTLLEYLHNTGFIFYQKHLFDNQIIVDHAWLFDAIYAVLEHDYCYQRLQAQRGRFTLEDLGNILWTKWGYSPEDQKHLIEIMLSADMCFEFIEEKKDWGQEVTYIAPDHLPKEPHYLAQINWDKEIETKQVIFEYDFLLPGLMRSILSTIGNQAGLGADFWHDGVLVYEKNANSKAKIEANYHIDGEEDWRGTISVKTQQGRSEKLLNQLAQTIASQEKKFGLVAEPGSASVFVQSLRSGSMRDDVKIVHDFGLPTSSEPGYFISYAHKNNEHPNLENIVDKLDAYGLKHNKRYILDRKNLQPGESLARFMAQSVKDSDYYILVLSDRYFRSVNCMGELTRIWFRCQTDKDQFRAVIRPFMMDCAKIGCPTERKKYKLYWKKEQNKIKVDDLSTDDFVMKNNMEKYAVHIPDMLDVISDMLQERDPEEFLKYAFDDQDKAS